MDCETTIRQFLEEVFNQGRLELLPDFVQPDFRYRAPGGIEIEGIEQLSAFIAQLRAAFPDARVEIEEVIATEDRASTRFQLTGTHRGAYLGIASTGRSIHVAGMVHSRFHEGKIAEDWEILDMHGMLQQLGQA
ncbi:MAG: ester cyclase [Opitutales bacterium]